MKKLHEKSPCCRGRIIKFGKRRKQCVACKKTWRAYRRKRGRKKKREPISFLLKYLSHEIPSLHALAKSRRQSEDTLNRRLNRSLEHFLKTSQWPALPQGETLVAIADSMLHTLQDQVYTIYFILLKKPGAEKAIITQPLIRAGPEVPEGWYAAFQRLPKTALYQIKALVCDGHTGLTSIAKRQLWIIQRCHFHLICRLQNYRSKYTLSRHGKVGQEIYRLVKKIIDSPEETNLAVWLSELESWGRLLNSRGLKAVISGFIRYYRDYRSYLDYPNLHLPKTTNAVESLISTVRNLCHRARGFRTLSSLTRWIAALLKNKRQMICNASNHQPN